MVVKKENAFKLDGKITYITINKLIAFLKECKRNHIKCVNLSFQEGTMALLPSVATILGGLLCHYKEKQNNRHRQNFEKLKKFLKKFGSLKITLYICTVKTTKL